MEYVTSRLTDGANAIATPAPVDARKCPNNGTLVSLPLFELQDLLLTLFSFSWLFIFVDELLKEALPLSIVKVPALRNKNARTESFARNYMHNDKNNETALCIVNNLSIYLT